MSHEEALVVKEYATRSKTSMDAGVPSFFSGMEEWCEAFNTGTKAGMGVRATTIIPAGMFLGYYMGELITATEAEAREDEYGTDSGNCYMFFFKWRNSKWCIDATTGNHVSRYINHSRKNANLRVKLSCWGGKMTLSFYTTRLIEYREELFFDYGDRRKDIVDANPWLAT